MAEELRVGEHSPRTESWQSDQVAKPKREGDLRQAEQRTGPRRRGDREKNWQGQIEYKQWKDRERRRLEGERRRPSHDRRQSERRGEQGDRRKQPAERRGLLNPRPHRSTDYDYRSNNNDDLSVRPEDHGRGTSRLDDSVGKQGPLLFQRFREVGRQVRERLLGSFH
jgi:hypothetical protein